MDAIVYNFRIRLRCAIIPYPNNQYELPDYLLLNLYIPASIYTLE